MKRFILRLTVAVLAFGFGIAIDRVLISRGQKPRTVWKLEPVISTSVPVCPATTPGPLTARRLEQNLIFHYNPAKFDPAGTYFPVGRLPKEFAEFDLFELDADESGAEVFGSGLVQTRINDTYESQTVNFLLITEQRLFFVAAPLSETEFEYRFDGEFLGNPRRLVNTGKAAVRGTLTKIKDGRKIATRVVSFQVESHEC